MNQQTGPQSRILIPVPPWQNGPAQVSSTPWACEPHMLLQVCKEHLSATFHNSEIHPHKMPSQVHHHAVCWSSLWIMLTAKLLSYYSQYSLCVRFALCIDEDHTYVCQTSIFGSDDGRPKERSDSFPSWGEIIGRSGICWLWWHLPLLDNVEVEVALSRSSGWCPSLFKQIHPLKTLPRFPISRTSSEILDQAFGVVSGVLIWSMLSTASVMWCGPWVDQIELLKRKSVSTNSVFKSS